MNENEKISILLKETDHYYNAELSHDQRGGWLIAVCTAILTIVATILHEVLIHKINGSATLLKISIIFLILSLFATILSLWPLGGNNKYWFPYRQKSENKTNFLGSIDELWVEKHFLSHKARAKKKAQSIIWSFGFLSLGLIFFLLSAFTLAPTK